MATLSQVLKEIKAGNLAPVYLILGKEEYGIKTLKNSILAHITPEARDFNVNSYNMEEMPLATALKDAMDIPFLGNRRIIFIENPYFLTGEKNKNKIEHDLDALQKYLEMPVETTSLIINAPYDKLDERKKIVKKLKQVAVVIDNSPLTEEQVARLLTAKAKKQQLTLEPGALEILLERTNADVSLALNELDKLMLLNQENNIITAQQAERMVSQSLEENVFDLVELVLKRKVQEALEMYHELLLSKQEPLMINAILLGQFRLLLQVSILKNRGFMQGSIVSTLKIHPYRVKLALRFVKQNSQADLSRAYLGLVKIEELLKSTSQDPELLFQLFMLQFSQAQVKRR
ncbi:DNA polymerase III, delta subunit [Ligilactobacillus sp. WC1T17]|uniref:DNA polymerase III subunit delta n=1 Tax=Ligilactobacillus ruminis TaxID=1623 RepID=A0ABY1ABR2_9LACO|nr:DNA polymerase III, delta subunit [Ligilactobacillus ruminis]